MLKILKCLPCPHFCFANITNSDDNVFIIELKGDLNLLFLLIDLTIII